MHRLLSIVIPTHNRISQLRQCLTALRIDLGPPVEGESEIVVIDDGSQAVEAVRNKKLCAEMGAVYHCVSSNNGAAAARNLGIDKTSGAWIAFLDDDVCIDPGWYRGAVAALTQSAQDVVGIEGRVRAQGEGVWDREVENAAGGLYLSCHIFYRRDILEAAGRFDEHFTSRYPSCEDHELACRMLMHGRIVFIKDLCVAHLPRDVKLPRYVVDSWYRMRSQLEAELYFFLKHRDRYHTVRHARTFWGTYTVITLRHWFVTIKRRTASVLLRHPLQSISLLSACLLEQLCALWLFPRLLQKFVRPPCRFFGPLIDSKRTREFWKLTSDMPLTVLALKPRLLRSLLFPITKRPVYSLQTGLREVQRISSCSGMRIFLRIDDVFL
ncbi:MAG TPA: glycosyltransferase family A protein, partial [Chitinivibrionales bacterium]